MKAHGYIGKTHLGFHPWKLCPLLLFIREKTQRWFWKQKQWILGREGKETELTSVLGILCYCCTKSFFLFKAPHVSVPQHYDCDGNRWCRIAPIQIRLQWGAQLLGRWVWGWSGQQRGGATRETHGDCGQEMRMCSRIRMSYLSPLNYFHLFFSL